MMRTLGELAVALGGVDGDDEGKEWLLALQEDVSTAQQVWLE